MIALFGLLTVSTAAGQGQLSEPIRPAAPEIPTGSGSSTTVAPSARTPIVRPAEASAADAVTRSGASPWGTVVVVGSLLVGLYLVSRWIRQAATQQSGTLAPTAIDLLGSTPITPQSAMHVIRVGDRLLIVGSGTDGLRTLTEISDPAEVAHLTHLCRAEQSARRARWNPLATLQNRRLVPTEQQLPIVADGDAPASAAEFQLDVGDTDRHASPRTVRPRSSSTRVAGWILAMLVGGNAVCAQSPESLPPNRQLSEMRQGLSTSPNPQRLPAGLATPAPVSGTGSAQLLPTWNGPPPTQALPTWTGPVPVAEVTEPGVSAAAPLPAVAIPSLVYRAGAMPVNSPGAIQRTAYYPEGNPAAESPAVISANGLASTETGPAMSSLLDVASPQGLGGTLRLGLLIGVMSLAPAILLMTTCYVRFIVVFGLLRQAIGVQQFPPTQVLTALSLFLTGLVMWPTWTRCWEDGVVPYTAAGETASNADFQLALTRTAAPVRTFMSRQIEASGNTDAIDLLMSYQAANSGSESQPPAYYEDVPLPALLPAYVLSELKTAFLIGFQIYLPFIVIDLIVSSVLSSLGLGMLSPAVVALPFKLLLFVLIDGWFLVVELLLQGIPPVT